MKCKILFLFLIFGLQTKPIHAWSTFTHRFVSEASLASVAKEWGLDESIVVTPFDSFLKKLSQEKPQIQTREDFAKWIQINPNSKFDRHFKEEKEGETTTPLKILSLYATKPDDGRDANLPYNRATQFWFGATEGPNSQAFRHMEKLAFDFRHPINTSGFPLGTLGESSQRAQIYFDLALLANKLGEPYWAWNFLGCALHYMEDLHQPYHSAQLIVPLAWEGLREYFDWGRAKGVNLIYNLSHIASNTHHYFEGYVEYMLRGESSTSQLWKKALKGNNIVLQTSIQTLAKQGRNFSNTFVTDTVQNTFLLTGDSLKQSNTYRPDDLEGPTSEDPVSYFNPNYEERSRAAAKISEIVLKDFEHQGETIRTTIRAFLDRSRSTRKGGEHAYQ